MGLRSYLCALRRFNKQANTIQGETFAPRTWVLEPHLVSQEKDTAGHSLGNIPSREEKAYTVATTDLKGSNFEAKGSTITFFDAKGMKIGKNWALSAFGMMVEVDPESIMDDVRACIAADIKEGKGERIAQLKLAPRQAVIFYLEGQLTTEHLKRVYEAWDWMEIPEVEVEGRNLTVRIDREAEQPVATADKWSNIL